MTPPFCNHDSKCRLPPLIQAPPPYNLELESKDHNRKLNHIIKFALPCPSSFLPFRKMTYENRSVEHPYLFNDVFLYIRVSRTPSLRNYVMPCAIWYHWYNFKKREKHPWRSVTSSKVAGFNLQF